MSSNTESPAGQEGNEKTDEAQKGGAAPVVERAADSGGGDKKSRESDASATHGFTRPEMHSEALVGTVNFYERHLFLTWKDPQSWPSQVESDGLPNVLGDALKARKNAIPKKTKLTVAKGQDGGSDGDVFIFPDRVLYKGLTSDSVNSFVEDVLVNGKKWKGSEVEDLPGSYIFVCCHASRDLRCGVCGPALIEKLKEGVKSRGLEDQIFVRACSHVGGHKYAGNVIVFSSGTGEGHWYGYVSPEDVCLILDQHIGKGEIIDRLWRGEMGVKEVDQKKTQEDRLSEVEEGKKTSQVKEEKGCGAAGCCQLSEPVEKVSKLYTPNVLQSAGSSTRDGHLIFFDDEEDTDEEPVEPRIPLWGPYYIPLPKWFGTWEKEDTNAALAVLGAAAAVALAVKEMRHAS